MKKFVALLSLMIICLSCFSQDAFLEFDKLNHALRGLSSMQFPLPDSVEQSMILRLTLSKKKKGVSSVEYLGNFPHPSGKGRCLCTAEEVQVLINDKKIQWNLLLVNWDCETAIVNVPIVFRNETTGTNLPKGFSWYRDCNKILFENSPSLGGCSILLKPIFVILERMIDN